MHSWQDELEMGPDGKLRRKRFARDGEQIHFSTMMMDAAAGRFHSHFSDGSPDHTSPHRPGYRFADLYDNARLAADAAYEQRSIRMADAWRHKGAPQDASAEERTPSNTHTPSLDARQAADQAYEDRNKRLRNAWRHD